MDSKTATGMLRAIEQRLTLDFSRTMMMSMKDINTTHTIDGDVVNMHIRSEVADLHAHRFSVNISITPARDGHGITCAGEFDGHLFDIEYDTKLKNILTIIDIDEISSLIVDKCTELLHWPQEPDTEEIERERHDQT